MCTVYTTPNTDNIIKSLEAQGFDKVKLHHVGNINMYLRSNFVEGKTLPDGTPLIGRYYVRIPKETTTYNNEEVHQVFVKKERDDYEEWMAYASSEEPKEPAMTDAELEALTDGDGQQTPEVQAADGNALPDGDGDGTIH
jgi:hypothetical protein